MLFSTGLATILALFLGATVALATVPVAGPTTFCEGESVRLEAGPGYRSYRWSTGAATRAITVVSGGRYSVFTEDSTGGTDSATVVVRMLPRPRPRIGNPVEYICSGETYRLSAPPEYVRYRWNTGDTTASIVIARSGQYFVTVVDTAGCSGTSDAIQLVVTERPPASIIGVNAVCLNAEATYTTPTAAGATYRWTATNGTILTGQGTPSVRIRWTGTGRVDVTTSRSRPDGGRCDSSASLFVQRGTRLRPELLFERRNICVGDSTELRATGGFRSYRWNTGATTPTIMVTVSGRYWVDVEDSSGCSGTSDSVYVNVQALPVLSLSASAPWLCPGDTVLLRATDSTGQTVLWDWSTGHRQATMSVTVPGTYSVTATTINGCRSTATIMVRAGRAPTVGPLPPVDLPTVTVGTVVEGDLDTLSGTGAGSTVTVDSCRLVQGTGDIIQIDGIPPFPRDASGNVVLRYRWQPQRAGRQQAIIRIFLRDECTDSVDLVITGEGIPGRRPVHLACSFGDTIVPAGTAVALPLTIVPAATEPDTAVIDVHCRWLAPVFRLDEALPWTILSSVRRGDTMVVHMRSPSLPLHDGATIGTSLRGLSLLGSPLATTVWFDSVLTSSDRVDTVTADDGSITIDGCWYGGRLVRFLGPASYTADVVQTSTTVEVRILTNIVGTYTARLYTADGRLHRQAAVNHSSVAVTDHTLVLATDGLAGGVYLLEIVGPGGQRSLPVLVVR